MMALAEMSTQETRKWTNVWSHPVVVCISILVYSKSWALLENQQNHEMTCNIILSPPRVT
jgi:hypothetical protein